MPRPCTGAVLAVAGTLALLLAGPAGAQSAATVVASAGVVVRDEASPRPPPLAASPAVAPVVRLAAADVDAREEIDALAAWNAGGRLPKRTGFVRGLRAPVRVHLPSLAPPPGEVRLHAGGVVVASAGGVTWSGRIEVAGARRLRLRLADVHLPSSARLRVLAPDGEVHAFGTDLRSPAGDLWTPSVRGDVLILEVELPAVAERLDREPGFELRAVLESRFDPDAVTAVGSCVVDGSCVASASVPFIDDLRRAVALLSFPIGAFEYLCTGGLLADTAASQTPYLLTANHCIATQAAASALEAWWDYRAASCDGPAPALATLPRSLGATLLATGTASDFTLLRLGAVPPGRTFLGWDASPTAVADGTVLHRLSHPAPGDDVLPQAYSRSTVRASGVPSCVDAPRPFFFYASMAEGGTFGGSSGSPVVDGAGRVVGQLSGGCGPDGADGCNYANSEYDGAFAFSYPALAPWLAPTATACVEDADTLCLQSGRFRVEADWRTAAGTSGRARSTRLTTDTGTFWFFSAANVEVVVKVLDGCAINGRHWVFAGGLTDVGVDLRVTDTRTGRTRRYANPLGTAFQPVQDTDAFATCP